MNLILVIAISTLIVYTIVYSIYCYFYKYNEQIETFVDTEKRNNSDLYDVFYAKIYDQLFYSQIKNVFEMNELRNNFLDKVPKKNIKILDVGCGTGQHVKLFQEEGYKVVGTDNSKHMIQIAKKNNPKANFIYGELRDHNLFPENQFTHITCYYFTIYYIKDLHLFIENISRWLKPKGIFAVHIVNKDKFDPLLDLASPFPAFSLQKYSKKRVTNSTIHFNNFVYTAKFDLPKKKKTATFTEIFNFKNKKKIRNNTHKLYMFNIKYFIQLVESAGFKNVGKTDLLPVSFEYQYIFYFEKK